MRKEDSKWILISIILVILNLIVKGIFISNNSIGGDEPFSIYHAQMDITSIIKLLSTGNNPPLYEIFLHFWIHVFGISELAVRFPSLIFSTITVFFIFRLGVKHLNIKVAIYSSILFIFSNYQISFSHEARVYSLLGMLTIISMYYFLELLASKQKYANEPNNKLRNIQIRYYVSYIASSILLIYSHYFGFFVLIVQLMFFCSNKQLLLTYWKQLLLTFAILAILYAPYILIVFNRFLDSSANGTWVKAPNGIESIYNMLRIFSNKPLSAVAVILICLVAILKSFVERNSYKIKFTNKLIVFWFVFTFFFMYGISYLIPMFLDRYLMPASIAFCILIGIALDNLVKRKRFEYIAPAILCILFIATSNPKITNKRNVKETVKKIQEIKDNNTLVIICPRDFILNYSYYQNIKAFKNYNVSNIYKNIDDSLKRSNIFCINSINDIDFKSFKHIIYLDAAANFSFPNNNVQESLNKTFQLKNQYKFYEIFNVYEYKLD